MKYHFIWMLIFSLAAITSHADLDTMGRVIREDDGYIMGFPGVTVQAAFTATSELDMEAEILAGGEAHFNVWINGHQMESLKVAGNRKTYNIVSQLDPAKSYHLRLVRRTEAWQGTVKIFEIAGSSGMTWLKPPKQPVRKLMVIGDSITCGAAAAIKEPFMRTGHHNSNAKAAYGYVLAKRLNAQVHIIGYGGKGLMRDWQGLATEVTAPQFFERVHPDWPEPQWDHQQYIPDAVIICLGQNDFNQGIIAQDEYVRNYIAFCDRIFDVYPETRILLCSSPMHGSDDPQRLALEAYLQLVKEHFISSRMNQVRIHKTKVYDGTSLEKHPTAQQHKELADDLYPIIGEWLGWLE